MVNDEDDLKQEEIERRHEVRGIFPGLRIELQSPRTASFEAVEASRKGFFVRVDAPDAYKLEEVFEAVVSLAGRNLRCRLEVVRKEIVPRRGVALRIAHIDPISEETLKAILGPAAEN